MLRIMNEVRPELFPFSLTGGSIMTTVYDNRPATKDIDCVFSETNFKLLDNIVYLIKFTLKTAVKAIRRTVPYFESKHYDSVALET